MSKLLCCALFIALTTLLACSGPETSSSPTSAAQAPTAASIPSPTTALAEVLAPTEVLATTRVVIPTAVPALTNVPSEATPESGTLAPLDLNDPGAFMSQLSSDEQSCISATGDPGQLLMLMNGPGPGSPQGVQDVENIQELVLCLGGETLLRLFLTGLISQTGPLSAETSTCVRRGFQDFDIAAVLLSSSTGPGGEAAAMMGSMAGFVLTLSCLNEDEWQISSSGLGLGPNDRESLECVTTQLGGPQGVAAAMQPKEDEPPTAYINAAMTCGLQTTGAPGPETPGSIVINDTKILMSELSGDEQSCLSEIGDPQQLLTLMNSPELASPEERDAVVRCLEDEILLKLFLKGFTDQTGPLSDDTQACVSTGFQDFDLRSMMLSNTEESGEEAAMIQGMAGFLIAISCLNEEEWLAASPVLELSPDDRESLQCVMNMLGGPEGFAASLEPKDGEPPLAFFNAATECGLTIMEGPSG